MLQATERNNCPQGTIKSYLVQSVREGYRVDRVLDGPEVISMKCTTGYVTATAK